MGVDPVSIDAVGNMTTAPPTDGRPTLGWTPSRWKAKHGPKQGCAKCGRGVRDGVQHHRHTGPGNAILCHRCYRGIMDDPGPGGWGPVVKAILGGYR
jgi:hypothetical protein